jgi:SP family arabinose:H+ symporter-like MFS transporter
MSRYILRSTFVGALGGFLFGFRKTLIAGTAVGLTAL